MLAIPPHDALQLLHIVQEALTNVVKHARARHATVVLRLDGGTLALDVLDDGPGPPDGAAATTAGRGRLNMATRAARLGGTLEIVFGPAGGRVSLRMPLATGADEPRGVPPAGVDPAAAAS